LIGRPVALFGLVAAIDRCEHRAEWGLEGIQMPKQSEPCPKCSHAQTAAIDTLEKYQNKRVAGSIERVKVSTVIAYRCPKCGHVFTRTVPH